MVSRPPSTPWLLLAAVTTAAAALLFLGSRQPHAAANCDRAGGGANAGCAQAAVADGETTAPSPDTGQAGLAAALATALAASSAQAPPQSPVSSALPTTLALRLALPGALVPANGFIWPVSGPITQPFGVPELGVGAPHTGIDIGLDAGSPVHAALPGRVVFSGGDPCCGLGYWIEINHGNRLSTVYAHFMRPPIVLVGDYVNRGQILGFSGTTGFSTGPHLHFEVRLDGSPIDPMRVLPSR